MTKPFKDTQAGQWIGKNAPNLIDTIEGFVPAPVRGGMEALKKLIGLQPNLTPEQKDEFNKIAEAHEQMLIQDVQNARAREVEVTKATGKKDTVLMILAFSGIALPVLLIFYLMAFGFPPAVKDISNLISGFIGMIVSSYPTIFNYYFGSSTGSKAKQDTIDNIAKN